VRIRSRCPFALSPEKREEPSLETLEGNKPKGASGGVSVATPTHGNGLACGAKPCGRRRRRGDSAVWQHGVEGPEQSRNDERATAAVTRYGCSRGKSSEGYALLGMAPDRETHLWVKWTRA
jgi:hypothetical protein